MNVYGFVASDPVNRFEFLGKWHASVHRDMTITWAYEAAFSLTGAVIIGFEDLSVDTFPQWSLPWIGQQDRHMRYIREGIDSRTWWFRDEDERADSHLRQADRTGDLTWCVEAAKAFGRGLHSLQDRSAHRPWPEGGDWYPIRIHPSWWDAWTDAELGYGYDDDWWNQHGHRWGRDYLPWYGDAEQVASQGRARALVSSESQAALRTFADRVRRSCVCRSWLLSSP